MRLSDAVFENLKSAIRDATKEAQSYIGKSLVWDHPCSDMSRKLRPYKGRKCKVRDATYCESTGKILVVVATEGIRPDTWLDDNDSFHRQYRPLSCFEMDGESK